MLSTGKATNQTPRNFRGSETQWGRWKAAWKREQRADPDLTFTGWCRRAFDERAAGKQGKWSGEDSAGELTVQTNLRASPERWAKWEAAWQREDQAISFPGWCRRACDVRARMRD